MIFITKKYSLFIMLMFLVYPQKYIDQTQKCIQTDVDITGDSFLCLQENNLRQQSVLTSLKGLCRTLEGMGFQGYRTGNESLCW